MTLSLYTLHSTKVDGEFIIQKFDGDYRCESVYALTSTECQCPQGHKPKCRHRTMLGMFLAHGHIGDGWFLEWDTRMWRRPVNPMIEINAERNAEATFEIAELADETVMGTSAPRPQGLSQSLSTEALPSVSGVETDGHDSDCATHNEPAYLNGPCDCSLGAEAPALPPSPPEGRQPAPSAEATPSSPVVGGVTIVKRRKIP